MSKLLKTQMVRRMTSRPMTSRIWVSVMNLNLCSPEAPSTMAASCCS